MTTALATMIPAICAKAQNEAGDIGMACFHVLKIKCEDFIKWLWCQSLGGLCSFWLCNIFVVAGIFMLTTTQAEAKSIHKYRITADSTWIIDVIDEAGHFNYVKEVYKGDIVYGVPPKDNRVYIQVIKVNNEWLNYKRANHKKAIPGDLLFMYAEDLGYGYPGVNPYMDDPDFILSTDLFSWVPVHRSHKPVFIALFLAILLLIMDMRESSLLGRIIIHQCLCLTIIIHFMGCQYLNPYWFFDDTDGFFMSTLSGLGFTIVMIATTGNALYLLYEASNRGGFPTSLLVGICGFVAILPAYFVLWIFTDFPVRYTSYFLIATQVLQMIYFFKNWLENDSKFIWLLVCILAYPLAVTAAGLIAKAYIYNWLMEKIILI